MNSFIKFFAAIIIFNVVACIRHDDSKEINQNVILNDTIFFEDAEGLEVSYTQNGIKITSHSIGANSFFTDSIFLNFSDKKDQQNMLLLPYQPTSVLCQSSTHLAFFRELDALHCIKGICGMEYLTDENLIHKLNQNHVEEICNSEQINFEQIQKINPDIFLIYPFETEGKKRFNQNNITTFYIAEYLEKTAIARLEWIKFFGLMTGKLKEANNYFNQIKSEYESLKKIKSETSPKFILNLPYKETWWMPSPNSMIVNLIEDAGLQFYYSSNDITENEQHSTEKVWNDANYADYWIIMANRPNDFSLKDLLSEEKIYATFKSVKENKVIFCNTSTSGYFIDGVVEPHILLKDLLFITGQLENHTPKYFKILN